MNTTQTPHRQDQQPVAFIIVEGTRTITLDQEITTIGRKADNHIVINHEYVSRHHAHIRFLDGHYLLEDLHSTVGTSLNGVRIQRAVLQPGDIISLGGAPIIFGLGTPKGVSTVVSWTSCKPGMAYKPEPPMIARVGFMVSPPWGQS